MAYRIVIHMASVPGAEARLWALVSQRHVDVNSAQFEKNRETNRIEAALEVDLSLAGAKKLMRQLERHYDIQHMALDLSQPQIFSGKTAIAGRRLRLSARKGVSL